MNDISIKRSKSITCQPLPHMYEVGSTALRKSLGSHSGWLTWSYAWLPSAPRVALSVLDNWHSVVNLKATLQMVRAAKAPAMSSPVDEGWMGAPSSPHGAPATFHKWLLPGGSHSFFCRKWCRWRQGITSLGFGKRVHSPAVPDSWERMEVLWGIHMER